MLIGIVTTIAMHSYLFGRLDDQVMQSLHRGPDGDSIGPPPGLGTELRTVTGVYPDEGDDTAFVISTQPDHRAVRKTVSSAVTDQLDKVPADGHVHSVSLTALGDYRVVANDVTGGKIVTGLPTSEASDILSSLIWWEVLLGLLGVAAAGTAGTSSYAASSVRSTTSHRRRTRSPCSPSSPATSASPSGCQNASPTSAPRSARSAPR